MKNGWAIGSTYSITKCRVFQAAQVKNTRTQAQTTHTTLRVLPHRALYACVCVYICMCMHLYDCQLQKGHTINYFHLLEWEFVRNHLKRPCCCCNRVLRATHSAVEQSTNLSAKAANTNCNTTSAQKKRQTMKQKKHKKRTLISAGRRGIS